VNICLWVVMSTILLVGIHPVPADTSPVHSASFSVTDLRCEDLVDPLGIETATPRFSWRMASSARGAAQGAYQVVCATRPGLLDSGKADLWDTGKLVSDASRFITYGGKEIKRGMPCYWAVRIWPARHSPGDGGDENDKASAWSKPAVWTYAGLASDSDWQARWITDNTSSPWLRQTVTLETVPNRATIYVNALGYFQLFINSRRVGDDEFAPHVGQFNKRTFCITYDVTKHLKRGKNAIGFWLGSGWSRGGAGVKVEPAVRAQLEMLDAGGKTTTLITDETWRAKASSLTYRGSWRWGNFGGEVHTGSEDRPDWANADFDDSGWRGATTPRSRSGWNWPRAKRSTTCRRSSAAAGISVTGPRPRGPTTRGMPKSSFIPTWPMPWSRPPSWLMLWGRPPMPGRSVSGPQRGTLRHTRSSMTRSSSATAVATR